VRYIKLKADPVGEPRNPLAVYLLALCLISGISLLVGVSTSGSIEAELPFAAARVWGAMLTFGAGSTLLGMFWQGDRRTGLLIKRGGLLALSIAAFIYAAVIITAAGMDGAFISGLVLGFGVATTIQFVRINRRVHQIIRAS
jgi:hypothetical protein